MKANRVIGTNMPKPYTVLTRVKSESGSWEYEIRTSHRTGVTYCTCKGYGFHKTCKHMEAYNKNPVIAQPSATPAINVPKVKSPGEVLVAELAMLGIKLGIASANAISTRVLAAGGRVAASGTVTGADMINADNVRVIVLPD